MSAPHLHAYRVLSVDERACRVWADGKVVDVRFSATFPAPRVERVVPGHLVAVTSGSNIPDVVVWRWFDAVVVGSTESGSVRLWEPAHGEIVASVRKTYAAKEPGCRAYVSAGLPGAEWWVACGVGDGPGDVKVDLDEVVMLYNDNNLWSAAFDLST
jgi:hypothetical protein